MTVNLAQKYSSKVDERFKLGSLTASVINYDYDWTDQITQNPVLKDTAPPMNFRILFNR